VSDHHHEHPHEPATAAGCGEGCGCHAERPEHWRSLEALAGTPEARAFREREFPVGASELPEGVNRRELVQLLGASLSLAGLAACRKPVHNIVPYTTPPEEMVPGMPKRYATTMAFGTAAYGLLVESHEGRPTKIEGNELHPTTLGSASAHMQASILDLYDPDRSPHVLTRGVPASGETEAAKAAAPAGFERKAWADFLAAWKPIETEQLTTGGAGLAVLAPVTSAPTLARVVGLFRKRFPQARFVSWEPVSDENLLSAAAAAAGRPVRVHYDTSAARVLLSLDADLFLAETGAVAHARGFAAGRSLVTEKDSMNRLWVVESAVTTTGAMADHRLAIPSGRIGAFAAALVAALGAQGVSVAAPTGPAPADVPARFLAALAKDLAANRGHALVVAGRDQSPAVHAIAFAINAALGAFGATVSFVDGTDLQASTTQDLAALVEAMRAGTVSSLFVLGGNPVFSAPADFAFEAALGKVKNVIHLGHAFDETAAHAHWHLPEAHFFEAWGDARASDGTLSVVQPLIAPLLGGHSALDVLTVLATGAEAAAYDTVKETWKAFLPAADFDYSFNRVLHDGLLPKSALPVVAPVAFSAPGAPAAGGSGLELVLRASPAVHDGRFANIGWLQELPDAITKMTWGNGVLLAPKTAARLGLENEDAVKLSVGEAAVELPVWIVPGQAEETVVVHYGYGRTSAGRVGSGVGANLYPFRRSAQMGHVPGATLAKTGRTILVAQTQDHGTMEGRPIVREASLTEWRKEPSFAPEMVETPKSGPMFTPPTRFEEGPQWGMAIDLTACTGCNACVIACQSENNVPVVGFSQVRNGREMHWLRMDRYFAGDPETAEVLFQPMPCQQCENAPCEQVCPVAATVHTSEGLNAMVYNRCIGTRYCSNNCPYKVRRFNFFNFTKDTPELMKLAANPNVTVRSRGVMEKCTYCVQRIQAAKIDAKMAERPLKDGDIRTACQQTCPTGAIVFGDIRDAKSAVVERKARNRNYVVLAELGNKPRTSYLARIRNPHPDLAEA
jgi:molybdopterin-containing oxidoreductase family iron-sulfur binding subunit